MAEGDANRDVEAYLARIRRTIAESSRLVEQADLRIRETDRMLESQGLTREQVMGMRFTDSQREAVNAELVRRGMEPLDDEGNGEWGTGNGECQEQPESRVEGCQSSELAERQRKFGMMMKPFQI